MAYPQCATVNASFLAEKKGVAGASSECNSATDAVAPQACVIGSLDRLWSTWKKVKVARASRSRSSWLGGSVIQGARMPPLNLLKYPPRLRIQSYNSGIELAFDDSNSPCSSWRRYWDTPEPPCLREYEFKSSVCETKNVPVVYPDKHDLARENLRYQ